VYLLVAIGTDDQGRRGVSQDRCLALARGATVAWASVRECHPRAARSTAHVAAIAREARGQTFAIDEQNRRATNVYLWESEDAARDF
jgi:hypothetical protein